MEYKNLKFTAGGVHSIIVHMERRMRVLYER